MKIGWAVRDITPLIPVAMGGYGDRQGKSNGVLDSIFARALYIEDSKRERVIFISADLIGLSKKHTCLIRDRVNKSTGVSMEHIVVSTTHTHSGPLTCEYPGMGRVDEAYVSILLEIVIEAGCESKRCLEECKVGWFQTRFDDVGASRRESGKKVETYLTVTGFKGMDGRLRAVLFNYNCHPTVFSAENMMISPDYPGAAVSLLKKVYGSDVLFSFTNGACGDISTRFTRRAQNYEEVNRLGNILGAEVIKGISKMEYKENCKLSVKAREFYLKPKDLPDDETLESTVKECQEKFNMLQSQGAASGELRTAYTEVQGAVVQKMLKQYQPLLDYGCSLTAVKIGDGVIATVPAELFSLLGSQIINGAQFKPTAVMGYSNGEIGYVPDRDSFSQGGYEALSCRFEVGEGEKLRDMALELINELEV